MDTRVTDAPAVCQHLRSKGAGVAYGEPIRWDNGYFPTAIFWCLGITAFLPWLAVKRNVAPSTQNHAFSAVLFRYREVLHQNVGQVEHVPHAKVAARMLESAWARPTQCG